MNYKILRNAGRFFGKLICFAVMMSCAVGLVSCIEDGYTSSPSDRPTFSTDTVDIGTVITTDLSMTSRFTVRNPHPKGLLISDIRLEGVDADCFRLNVDGFTGTAFTDVEIRANDSIYVFVSCLLPENNRLEPVDVTADIRFTTNGVADRVAVRATGRDVTRLHGHTVTDDAVFDDGRPYQIFDSLIVAPGARLTLPPGTSLMFHDGAYMRVYGTLAARGTVGEPVELRGDRTGDVISGITFDLMAGQWRGLDLMAGSRLEATSTVIRNTVTGVTAEDSEIVLANSRLRNSQYRALTAVGCMVSAVGCEFAEAPYGTVYVQGGEAEFDHCTFPNYYLFSAVYEPAVTLAHVSADNAVPDYDAPYTKARITNSILYGLGPDITPGDLDGTDIYVANCLLKSPGTDDEHFVACVWDADPLYYTVREDYIFDYRLKPESPAIGKGNAALSKRAEARTDAYGLPRGDTPDLGAYVFVEP